MKLKEHVYKVTMHTAVSPTATFYDGIETTVNAVDEEEAKVIAKRKVGGKGGSFFDRGPGGLVVDEVELVHKIGYGERNTIGVHMAEKEKDQDTNIETGKEKNKSFKLMDLMEPPISDSNPEDRAAYIQKSLNAWFPKLHIKGVQVDKVVLNKNVFDVGFLANDGKKVSVEFCVCDDGKPVATVKAKPEVIIPLGIENVVIKDEAGVGPIVDLANARNWLSPSLVKKILTAGGFEMGECEYTADTYDEFGNISTAESYKSRLAKLNDKIRKGLEG